MPAVSVFITLRPRYNFIFTVNLTKVAMLMTRPPLVKPTRSSAVAETPRDTLCHVKSGLGGRSSLKVIGNSTDE